MAQHSSSSTNSNQATSGSFTGSQTPTNPSWVTPQLEGLGGYIAGLGGQDPHSFVAGANPLQTQAGSTLSGLTGSPWNYDGAASLMRGVAGAGANTYDPFTVKAASVLDNLPGYMSPYTDSVVNSTLKGYDQNANQQTQQANLGLAGDSTFGGSGGSIMKALLAGQQGMGRAQTEAQLRDQAFTTGAGLASGDADRKTQTRLADMAAINGAGQFNATQRDADLQRQLDAAGGLVGVSGAYDANQRANAGSLAGLGGTLQGIDQTQAGAPLSLATLLSGAYGNLPLNLLHGTDTSGTSNSTTTGTSNTSGNQFGLSGADAANMAAAAAMAFSDRGLKHNIKKVGVRDDGLNVYEFSYHGSAERHIGVMAQEVLKVKPEAVTTTLGGFLAVDYGMLR